MAANPTMDAISRGGGTANQGMSIAGSMMNGVLQSMNSTSDLLFKYQNMLKNEQARKFAQGMQIQNAIQDQYKTQLQNQWKERGFDIAEERNDIARKQYQSSLNQSNERNTYNRFNMYKALQDSTPRYIYEPQPDGTSRAIPNPEYIKLQDEMKQIANGFAPSAVAKTITPPSENTTQLLPNGTTVAPSSLSTTTKPPVTEPTGEDPALTYNDFKDVITDLGKYRSNGVLVPDTKVSAMREAVPDKLKQNFETVLASVQTNATKSMTGANAKPISDIPATLENAGEQPVQETKAPSKLTLEQIVMPASDINPDGSYRLKEISPGIFSTHFKGVQKKIPKNVTYSTATGRRYKGKIKPSQANKYKKVINPEYLVMKSTPEELSAGIGQVFEAMKDIKGYNNDLVKAMATYKPTLLLNSELLSNAYNQIDAATGGKGTAFLQEARTQLKAMPQGTDSQDLIDASIDIIDNMIHWKKKDLSAVRQDPKIQKILNDADEQFKIMNVNRSFPGDVARFLAQPFGAADELAAAKPGYDPIAFRTRAEKTILNELKTKGYSPFLAAADAVAKVVPKEADLGFGETTLDYEPFEVLGDALKDKNLSDKEVASVLRSIFGRASKFRFKRDTGLDKDMIKSIKSYQAFVDQLLESKGYSMVQGKLGNSYSVDINGKKYDIPMDVANKLIAFRYVNTPAEKQEN